MPLFINQLPISRKGLTDFTFSRYLAPYLCGYQGNSLFIDADMLCRWDVCELEDEAGDEPVSVVKGEQRFEWPSLMFFRNEKCKKLTPEYIDNPENSPQSFDWADSVGDLDSRWNHCVGYDKPRAFARIVHYTRGIPHFPETKGCEYSGEWWNEYHDMTSNCSWLELMGTSVHAQGVLEELNKKATAWQNR